ncbi:carotenoid biosynthesis protein [soil metagenome]
MLPGILRSTPIPLILASAFFFVAAYFPLRFPATPGAGLLSLLATITIALPAVVGLFRFLGPRGAMLSILMLTVFAYGIEALGVATGFPYGEFYYGDSLGPKVFGLVPYLLPVSYLPLVVAAVAAAWRPRRRLCQIFGAAVLLTLMDGVLDPGAAALGFWIWPEGGLYYGVPLGNYAGWLFSGALAATIMVLIGHWREPPHPMMLDSAIIAVAFWTGTAIFVFLPVPALLGAALFLYLLHRRSQLSRNKHTHFDAVVNKPGSGW